MPVRISRVKRSVRLVKDNVKSLLNVPDVHTFTYRNNEELMSLDASAVPIEEILAVCERSDHANFYTRKAPRYIVRRYLYKFSGHTYRGARTAVKKCLSIVRRTAR